jgi:hypothetical protein
MPVRSASDIKFEIRHVLFIDIVGYSKLLITQQSGQVETLKAIVRGTEQFQRAESEGKLLRLPTGDGVALVFRTSSEAPVLCAMEISKELKKYPELRVRMGIHSGPVNEITRSERTSQYRRRRHQHRTTSNELWRRRPFKRLRHLLAIPAGQVTSIACLKIDPVWDPIRNRPDFQQLLSGPEQIGSNK